MQDPLFLPFPLLLPHLLLKRVSGPRDMPRRGKGKVWHQLLRSEGFSMFPHFLSLPLQACCKEKQKDPQCKEQMTKAQQMAL